MYLRLDMAIFGIYVKFLGSTLEHIGTNLPPRMPMKPVIGWDL